VLVAADAVASSRSRIWQSLPIRSSWCFSKAAAPDDGIASIPGGLNKAAAAKVAASLVSRKLMREVRSKPVPSQLGRVVVKRFQTSSIGPVVMSVAGSALLFGIGTQALP
jgi:hypothetical protein